MTSFACSHHCCNGHCCTAVAEAAVVLRVSSRPRSGRFGVAPRHVPCNAAHTPVHSGGTQPRPRCRFCNGQLGTAASTTTAAWRRQQRLLCAASLMRGSRGHTTARCTAAGTPAHNGGGHPSALLRPPSLRGRGGSGFCA